MEISRISSVLVVACVIPCTTHAQRQMERLGRGVIAVPEGERSAFVSWRLLGTDPEEIAFNIYRATGKEKPIRLNPDPITGSTSYVDRDVGLSKSTSYFVRPIVAGKEQEPS